MRRALAARRLYNALIEFHPELTGTAEEGYRVSVELGTSERRMTDILNAIEEFVTDAKRGPAHFDVDGHRYTMHPAHG